MAYKVNVYYCPECGEDYYFPFREGAGPCECDYCNTWMYPVDTDYCEEFQQDDVGFNSTFKFSSDEEIMPF